MTNNLAEARLAEAIAAMETNITLFSHHKALWLELGRSSLKALTAARSPPQADRHAKDAADWCQRALDAARATGDIDTRPFVQNAERIIRALRLLAAQPAPAAGAPSMFQREPGGDWYVRDGDGAEHRLLDIAPTLERDALKDPAHVAARMVREDDRFYGDPVERFEAMAGSASVNACDAVHFRMWCRIAADEIKTARSKASHGRLQIALAAALRAAKLAVFALRKQDAMPNSSWERGLEDDIASAETAIEGRT